MIDENDFGPDAKTTMLLKDYNELMQRLYEAEKKLMDRGESLSESINKLKPKKVTLEF